MRKNNWFNKAVFLFAFLAFLPAIIPQVAAETSTYLAQASSNYTQYMTNGYAATSRRDYRQALGYFQQALQARPGDRYARAAITNVQGYINRRGNRITLTAGRSTGTIAGARRGERCIEPKKDIVPIVPTEDKNSSQDSQNDTGEREAPKTSQAHPTFFFYVPIKVDSKPQLFVFSLSESKNANKNVFYQKYKPIDQPGIVRVSIPSSSQALEAGKEYTWTFSAICNRNDFSIKDGSITGQIQRTQLDTNLQGLLQSLQGLEKVRWYASSGYWEDALRELSNLPRNNETLQTWKELLESENIKPEVIQAYPPVDLQPE